MIAICSLGFLGLITSETKVEVSYFDGSRGLAWTGIHLGAENFGEPWSSREPTVLKYASKELAQLLRDAHQN
jgi:hypothetical protein